MSDTKQTAAVADALRDLGDMLREIGDDRERAARSALQPGDLPARAAEGEGTE